MYYTQSRNKFNRILREVKGCSKYVSITRHKSMEKSFFRIKQKDGTISTVKFDKENISDLMEHQVNPLYQKEYTIYVICENKPKKKNIYRFRRFEN